MKADRLNELLAEGREDTEQQVLALEGEYREQIGKAGGRAARALVRSQTMTAAADWEPPPWNEILAAAMLGVTFAAIRRRRMLVAYLTAQPLMADIGQSATTLADNIAASMPERTAAISDALAPEIRAALQTSREEGWTVRQTARHLRSQVGLAAEWQANLLARTDALTLSNTASHAAVAAANEEFRKAGEPEFRFKRWLTAHDERVRPAHAAANGQAVPFNEPFQVGGALMQYPCDPAGGPDNVWNCRCVATYHETATPAVLASAAAEAMTALAEAAPTEFYAELLDHMTRRIEDPASASAIVPGIPLSAEMAEALREWQKELMALPREVAEQRLRDSGMLIPPLAPLPSAETEEDTVSENDVSVQISPKFGFGVFADDNKEPIGFVPLDTIQDGEKIVGFSNADNGEWVISTIFDPPLVVPSSGNGVDLNHWSSWPNGFLPDFRPAITPVIVPDLTAAVTVTVEDEDATEETSEPIPWEGVLSVEGLETGDGRYMFPDAFTWRELPLTLMAMVETGPGGHQGAQVAGRIDEIWKVDAPDLGPNARRVMGRGVFAGSAFGQEIAQFVRDQILRGVSVDPGMVEVVLLDEELNEVPDDQLDMEKLFAGAYIYGFKSYEIAAATLCPVPGFKDASIAVLSVEGKTLVASTFGIQVLGETWQQNLIEEHLRDALTASAAPVAPPRGWFEMPEPDELTPMTITAEGRVYGHPATWECHEGFRDRCVMAPRSRSNLAYFHTGEMLTAEGDLISVGRWTVGGGHASINETRVGANAHYDNVSTVGAFLKAKEGRHGIWVCGALKSNLTDEQLRDMRANPPSGDWREGELILVHSVPVQGLPVFRGTEARVLVASDGLETTVALITPPVTDDCDCDRMAEYEIRIEALSQLAELDD